jgi:hypothetical protein
LASTAFGSDAIRGAIFAAKDGDVAYRNMLQSVGRLGAAHQMAAAQMQGWPGVIEGIKNSIEGMQLTVFDSFNAIAKGFGPGLTGGFDKIGQWLSAHQPEMIQAFTLIGRAALTFGQEVAMTADVVMTAMTPMVHFVTDAAAEITKVFGGFATTLGKVANLPGIRSLLPSGMADDLRKAGEGLNQFGTTIQGFNQGWDATRRGIEATERTLSGWNNQLAIAGQQAQQAAEFTRALGQAHATMHGFDINITDNTPEVEARLKNLGVHLQRMPTGEVKVIADTAAGQQMIDSWKRQLTGTPVNIPIRPVFADAGEFQAKMLAWIQAVREGKNPGAAPSFDPTSGREPSIGAGGGLWGPKGRAPSTGPSLPAWARLNSPRIPPKSAQAAAQAVAVVGRLGGRRIRRRRHTGRRILSAAQRIRRRSGHRLRASAKRQRVRLRLRRPRPVRLLRLHVRHLRRHHRETVFGE